jgi:hypothetical protein
VKLKFQKFHPGSHQINTRTRRKKTKIEKKTKTEKKNIKKYPRTCTRACGTRVSETGTCMKHVGYSFEKKTHLPAVSVSALPAARRGHTRPIPAVPVSKPLLTTFPYLSNSGDLHSKQKI